MATVAGRLVEPSPESGCGTERLRDGKVWFCSVTCSTARRHVERSVLELKTSREVVLGLRGGLHIAHPLSPTTLCGKPVGKRLGCDAFGRRDVDGFGTWPHEPRPYSGYNACHACQMLTYASGNESRQAGAYA